MQGGATPHTTRIIQEVFTGAAIDAFVWPAKNPDINIIKNVWSVMLRRIKCVNPLPKMQLSVMQHARWMTEHHRGAHMAITGQRSAPTNSLSLNSWMDFWSCHYWRLKFVLRLMRSIDALIHVLKTCTKRPILPNKYKQKLFCKKLKMIFCSISWENGNLHWLIDNFNICLLL